MADEKPRVYTEAEVREIFLDHVRNLIDFWATQAGDLPVRECLEGVVHNIFAALDGSTLVLPRFIIRPFPYPEDQDFYRERGENWFPDADDQVDIGGHLRYFLTGKGED